MTHVKSLFERMLSGFLEVAGIAGCDISRSQIKLVILEPPLNFPLNLTLPSMKLVYVFMLPEVCLKVGAHAARTHRMTRIVSHYNPNVPDSLARKIISDTDLLKERCSTQMHSDLDRLDESTVRSWMAEHLYLVRFEMHRTTKDAIVFLLEAFLRCKLDPVYEGKRRPD